MRRAKIVCTLGPATSPRRDPRARRGGDGRRPAEPQPRQLRRPRAGLRERSGRRPTRRPRRRHPRRPAGARRSGSATFAGGPVQLDVGAASSPSRPRTSRATRHGLSTTYTGLPGDVKVGDRDPDRRRQGRARVVEVDGRRVVTDGRRGRHGLRPQGHQPARRGGQRAGDVGEGRRRPALGAAARRRPDRAVVRPHRRPTSSDVARIMDEEGVRLPVLAKIEKPQAVDNLEAIVDGVRRDHGRARRPRRRAAAASRCRWCRSAPSTWPAAAPSR